MFRGPQFKWYWGVIVDQAKGLHGQMKVPMPDIETIRLKHYIEMIEVVLDTPDAMRKYFVQKEKEEQLLNGQSNDSVGGEDEPFIDDDSFGEED